MPDSIADPPADDRAAQEPIEDKLEVPFTLSGKTGKLVIEVTPDSKEKKNKLYTYTLFYGSDERRADFLTDGTEDDYPGLAVRSCLRVVDAVSVDACCVSVPAAQTTVTRVDTCVCPPCCLGC